MRQPLIVLPEATQDLREAARWYNRQRKGLGQEFIGVVEGGMNSIAADAEAYPVWIAEPRYRRLTLQRFPYIIFYEIRTNFVEIVAVAHSSREPGFWTIRS